MEDFYSDPTTQFKIETAKVDALSKLRPYFQEPSGTESQELEAAIKNYLSKVLQAYLDCFPRLPDFPWDCQMETFASRTLDDGRRFANHPAVDRVASENAPEFAHICHVACMAELKRRSDEFQDQRNRDSWSWDRAQELAEI